jgi:citrate synthase
MVHEDIMAFADDKLDICKKNDFIPRQMYSDYGVKCGLRDQNGKGVLTGLTRISKIVSFENKDGVQVPCDGQLWYRGYHIYNIISAIGEGEYGFEKVAYLLLFGEYPDDAQLAEFREILAMARNLPSNFTKDVIMKAPSKDIMNSMTRSILTLASYDKNIGDNSLRQNICQAIKLIAEFPMLAVYGYHAYNYSENNESMYIHRPDPSMSTAENFLRMLRPDASCSPLEAKVLDTALILHMEHGGGNNSTFTTRVVTTSGTDTYSAIAAAMSSLKGPRHGGANLKVMDMMDDIRSHVKDWADEDEVRSYLEKIVDKEAFDKQGLIYGMGHAVYSISDPREHVLKGFVEELAAAKGREKEMGLYNSIEKLAPEIIAEKRKIYKGVSPNVDFYSGFVYEMLGIPKELYTPLFAIARIVGWSAHRLEELVDMDKIMRPAYLSVMEEKEAPISFEG